MIKGIDISRYQKFDSYPRLNQSKLAFVFIKASEGIYKDQLFDTHNEGFSKTCLLKGAYHFHRFRTKAKDQADVFINTVAPAFSALDLPPVLDIEDPTETITPAQCEKEIQIWVDRVEQALHVKPIIYTGRWYWTDLGRLSNSAKFKDYALWHAQYGPNYLPMYGGWQRPTFWQYSQNGFIQGLSGAQAAIDLDYFLEDIDALWGLTSGKSIKPSGVYNSKVEALQYMLNLNGFNSGILDGKFGAYTLNALHTWQAQSGLPQEDIVTPKMWQTLFGLEVV